MNAPGSWTTSAPASIAAGPSLSIASPMRDPRHLLTGSPLRHGGSYVREGAGAAYWRYRPATAQDWSGFNRLRMRIRPHDTGLASYRLVLALVSRDAGRDASDPLPFHFLPGLRPNEWNEVVWEFSELDRAKVTEFAILLPLIGPLGAAAAYDIEGFELQETKPEVISGWAIATTTIACNQHGYEPVSTKVALASPAGSSFKVIDAASGDNVAMLPARLVGSRIGRFAELDFTAITTSGVYRLAYGQAVGPAFSIRPGRDLELIEPLLNAFYADRCGHSPDGRHAACHQSLSAQHNGRRIPVRGGWHDAGNLCQGAYRTALATDALFETLESTGSRLPSALRQRLAEEGSWGLDWLLGTRFGDGYRVVDGSYSVLQAAPGAGDEIEFAAGNAAFEGFVFVATALRASRILAPIDPARARAARLAALEDYPAAVAAMPSDLSALPEGANLPAPHELLAYACLAAVAMFEATGEPVRADEAVGYAARMLQLQERKVSNSLGISGYYRRDAAGVRRVTEWHTSFADAPANALAALCAALPDHAQRGRWREAAALEAQQYLRLGAAQTTPFHHPPTAIWREADKRAYIQRATEQLGFAARYGAPDIAPPAEAPSVAVDLDAELAAAVRLGPEEWLRTFPIAEDQVFHGAGVIQLARALALATTSRLKGDQALHDLARLQLDWMLGRNPFGASFVYGVGQRYASFMLQWTDDFVGAMPVGMDSRRDQPFWPHTCHMTSREMWVVPVARMLALVSRLARNETSARQLA
jgi:hypothetical protein